VAASDWQAALGEPIRMPGRPTVYPNKEVDLGRLYDSMIEVIDVRTNRLLVSQRVAGYIMFAIGDGLFARYRQDDEGNPFIDVLRIELTANQ
jgi:hypothetical protein